MSACGALAVRHSEDTLMRGTIECKAAECDGGCVCNSVAACVSAVRVVCVC